MRKLVYLLLVLLVPSIFATPLPNKTNTKPKNFICVTDIKYDLKYSKHNKFGPALYRKHAKLYMTKELHVALSKANEQLAPLGLELLIYDAYRPFSATVKIWNSVVGQKGNVELVAPPQLGSDHNRGTAVDLTIVKKGTYTSIIPAEFDKIPWTTSPEIELLKSTMHTCGLINYKKEWWHYSLPNSKDFPICNFKN